MTCELVSLRLVREGPITYQARQRCNAPEEAAAVATALLRDEPWETFAVLLLDTRHRTLSASIVARGDISSVQVLPRQVFAAAIVANAAAVVLAHNHPSGDARPSAEDIQLTDRLVRAGRVLGIPVLDHLVVGSQGDWTSMRAAGGVAFDD